MNANECMNEPIGWVGPRAAMVASKLREPTIIESGDPVIVVSWGSFRVHLRVDSEAGQAVATAVLDMLTKEVA